MVLLFADIKKKGKVVVVVVVVVVVGSFLLLHLNKPLTILGLHT